MDETLFLYGTGRSAETRQQRRTHFPREQQARVGPWIVRPARRVAVRTVQLAKFANELTDKITRGTVQVQRGDGSVVPLEELSVLFTGVAPDFEAMSDAELHSLLRGEKPSVAVLRVLMKRTPVEERRDISKGFMPIVEVLAMSEAKALQALVDELDRDDFEYREKLRAEQQEADDAERERLAKEAQEQAAREQASREAAAKEEAAKVPTQPAPASEDQMDFTKAPEEAAVDATKHEVILEQQASDAAPTEIVDEPSNETPEEAAAADAKKVEGRDLPEGWRSLSNQKLQDLITSIGVTMPEKKNKAELTKVLENWLAGGS